MDRLIFNIIAAAAMVVIAVFVAGGLISVVDELVKNE
jgi:hypothetical protein